MWEFGVGAWRGVGCGCGVGEGVFGRRWGFCGQSNVLVTGIVAVIMESFHFLSVGIPGFVRDGASSFDVPSGPVRFLFVYK